MHPLEMTEGGLSEIEKRILNELAIGAGAMKVVVWVGPELSDTEVREKVR
jgi:rod shape-determining protein MreB